MAKGWLDNYNDSKVSIPDNYQGDGYSNVGRNYSPAWGGQFQMGGSVYPVNYVPQAQNGGLTFLQPTSDKLPEGYRIPYADPSSERAMSIGGEDGEPAYLIPTFKHGEPIYNAIEEFRKTGEHLGGPFKTWQEADKWEIETRHPAVEKGEKIMFPQEKFAMGGSIPGAVGFSYARTQGAAPSNGKYAKKTMASAQEGVKLDMYGAPITAIEVTDPNLDRSHYDPRLNIVSIGNDYNIWHNNKGEQITGKELEEHRNKLKTHEHYHAKQHKEGRDNYDIAHHTNNEQWAQMQKRPQMMATDSEWNKFYNRGDIENTQDYTNYINAVPEARILNPKFLFDKVLDSSRYANPFNQEGEAMYYEQMGKEFSPYEFNVPKNKNGGHLNKYDVAQDGDFLDKFRESHPSVRSLINDTTNRKIQSKGKGKEVKTVQKDNTKTVTPKLGKQLTPEQIEQRRVQQLIDKQGTITASTPQSTSSRLKEIALNPLTAFGYAARNENLPENFSRGERNSLDMATDIINPAFYINQGTEAIQNTGSSISNIAQGNLPAAYRDIKNAGMNTLNALPIASEYESLGRVASEIGQLSKQGLREGVDLFHPVGKALAPKIKKTLAKGVLPILAGARDLENFGREAIRGINDNVIYPIKYRKQIADIKKLHGELASQLGADEGVKRLNGVLGIDPTNLDYPSLTTTAGIGSHYSPLLNNINMDFRQLNKFKNSPELMLSANTVHGHEVGHWMQREANRFGPAYQEKLNKLNKFKNFFSPIATSEPTVIDRFAQQLYGYDKGTNMIDISDVSNQVDVNTLYDNAKYFTHQGTEALPHLREMRQNMLNKGYIKNIYDPISEETINKFISENPTDRISSFTKHGSKQTKGLETIFRNLPSVVGAGAVGAGAAYQMQNQQGAPQYEEGGIIKDDRGQWDHPGEITRISGGNITMGADPKTGKALTEPLLGIADTGEQQMMYPGEDYNFEGANYVTEYPKGKKPKMAKNGLRQEQKGLVNLNQLTNFTNYNTKQPGGWLDQYQ